MIWIPPQDPENLVVADSPNSLHSRQPKRKKRIRVVLLNLLEALPCVTTQIRDIDEMALRSLLY